MNILVSLLILVVVISILYWIITIAPFLAAPPLRNIAMMILAVIALIWVLNLAGLIGGGPWIRIGRG